MTGKNVVKALGLGPLGLNVRTSMNMARFLLSLIVLVFGALILADGVLGWVADTSLFFGEEPPLAKFLVGLVFIMIAASLMPRTESVD